jgi:hypothetical protein
MEFDKKVIGCIKSNLKEGVTFEDVQQHLRESLELKTMMYNLGFKTKADINLFISELFSFKSVSAFENSSARRRYEKAICSFYAFVKSKERGEKENETSASVD